MEPLAKLQSIATDMYLEPAEEIPATGRSVRPVLCGCAPSDLPIEMARRRDPAIPDFSLPDGVPDPLDRQQAVTKIVTQTLAHRGLSGPILDHKAQALGIFDAALPGGRRAPLLKTMLTSVCERNCFYCPFRAGRDYRRATFQPDELASLFDQMVRANLVEGLFLSSGVVAGGVSTQDRLIDTADILRNRLNYRGYLHLKIMPGTEKEQLLRAMQLADRVSINLEAPNGSRLARLAPTKVFLEELLRPLKWAAEIRRSRPAHLAYKGRWPSTVTQFVVGAADEPDMELLQTTQTLIRQLHLTRVYFSAFQPIPGTPMENKPAVGHLRGHRLYQAFFLFRDYGFDLEEMPFDSHGNLSPHEDPKLAWARTNLLHDPVELNKAGRRQLLRVPGIGPKSADAILRARRRGTLRGLSDLRSLGISQGRVAPFILLDGRRPAHQLRLL